MLQLLGYASATATLDSSQIELELLLLAYAPATAMQDLSHVCINLHHSSWQHQILNPLIEARDGTCLLMDTSRVCYC